MEFNLSTWMKNLDGSRKLLSFNLPGTHDCATKYVQHSGLCKCQNLSISEQLSIGVRVLDVRVAPIGNRLALVHSAARIFLSEKKDMMYLENLLEDCYSFLEKNPSETIVLQFKNDFLKVFDKISFDILFKQYLKGNEGKWFLENRVPTLDEARGKIVLMTRCYRKDKDEYNNKFGLDLCEWIDQDKAVPDSMILETKSDDNAEIIISDRYKYNAVDRWEKCAKPFLLQRKVFDGQYILLYLSTAGGKRGPEYNAKYMNEKFLSFELTKENYYGIVYFDFVDEKLAKKIIQLNF